MKKIILLKMMLLLVLLIACDETKKVIEVSGSIQLSGDYTITSIDGNGIKNNKLPTIAFRALDKSVSGNGGCNRYFGNYTLDAFVLTFGELSATEMYCDEPIMEVERALFDALSNTASFTLENNVLTLYSKTNRMALLNANKKPQAGE